MVHLLNDFSAESVCTFAILAGRPGTEAQMINVTDSLA